MNAAPPSQPATSRNPLRGLVRRLRRLLNGDVHARINALDAFIIESENRTEIRRAAMEERLRIQLAGMSEHLGRIEGSQQFRLEAGVEALSAQSQRVESGLRRRLEDLAASLEGAELRLSSIGPGRPGLWASTLDQTLAGQLAPIREILSIVGPRFDEIDLKSRPLVPFDADTVGVRIADGYILVPTSEPVLVMSIADATTHGLERGVREVLLALIEPGMHTADVGANLGLLTLAMARAVGPNGRVASFEPEPRTRSYLERTVAMHGLRWVSIFPTAVGAKSEKTVFHVSTITGHHSLYPLGSDEPPEKTALEVEVRTLDEALGPRARLDVVKIDVEGAELDVLAGMTALLQTNPDLAIVAEFGPSHLARVGITPAAWFKAFTDKGFAAYRIAEPYGDVHLVSAKDVEDVHSVNIVFVRPGGKAASRLSLLMAPAAPQS